MKSKLPLLLCILGLLAGSASALSLEVESTANFVQSTAADLNRGYVELPAATRLTIEGDEPWRLYVRAEENYFPDSTKPTSHLLWRYNGPFRELTTQDNLVAEGTNNTVLAVDYRLKLSWLDPPAHYAVTLVYTLTTQGD
ncbi:MAG: hypothetical protein GX766_04360 [Firmicutes bacterium]|nr:hypothetical protein [Bacillota bacterium]